MFTAEVFSETTPFMHLDKRVFGSQKSRKYLSYEALFFSKCSQFYADSENAIKNEENVFSF